MNTHDPDYNDCSAPSEEVRELGDEVEFVEADFIPGSIVWAKMEGYPWYAIHVLSFVVCSLPGLVVVSC
jgi:hypothetical protein